MQACKACGQNIPPPPTRLPSAPVHAGPPSPCSPHPILAPVPVAGCFLPRPDSPHTSRLCPGSPMAASSGSADAGEASPDWGDGCAFSHLWFFSKSFGKLPSPCSGPDLGGGGGAEPALRPWGKSKEAEVMMSGRAAGSIPCGRWLKWNKIFFSFFFCLFLGPHPRHMGVPRLGVELELQLPAHPTATATSDPSLVCDLHHSA